MAPKIENADMAEGQTAAPPGKRTLALMVGGALVVATIVAVGFVLPAEFQIDPTGFGKITGLTKLGAPQPEVIQATAPAAAAHYYATPYRTDTITIAMPKGGAPGAELEYKVRMKAGDSMVYSWTTDADPATEAFYFDFHGETPAKGEEKAKVVEYRQLTDVKSNGALTAPIDGVHGWYFLNDNEGPVTVKLRISGFYTLVPPGEYGNETGIKADGQP